MAMRIMLDGDDSLFRRLPLPRHPLRLGDLSGRHLGAARCSGRVRSSTCALVTHAQAAGAGVSAPCLRNALGGE
jgi:hypothetical protein